MFAFYRKNKKKKLSFSLLLIVLLFFGLYLLYNQNKEASAADAIPPPTTLLCGKEIPSGEAMDKTGDLLVALTKELANINENAYREIQSAKAVIKSSGECDTNVCQPVDCESDTYYDDYPCADATNPCAPYNAKGPDTCHCPHTQCKPPQPCTSQWNFNSAYRACPQKTIESDFANLDGSYKKIDDSKKEIWALIDGTFPLIAPQADRRESLCAKQNDDIRSLAETADCAKYPSVSNPLHPKTTKIGVIERKLAKTRSEFDQCYIPPADWEKIARREKSGKVLLDCETVLSQDLPRETKTMQKLKSGGVTPICTSLLNYFCCH